MCIPPKIPFFLSVQRWAEYAQMYMYVHSLFNWNFLYFSDFLNFLSNMKDFLSFNRFLLCWAAPAPFLYYLFWFEIMVNSKHLNSINKPLVPAANTLWYLNKTAGWIKLTLLTGWHFMKWLERSEVCPTDRRARTTLDSSIVKIIFNRVMER